MNRKELIDVLKLVKPGVKENSIIEQANLAIFNKTHVSSYNSEIAISVPFETDIEAAIPFNTFLKLLEKIKEEKIDVNINDESSEVTLSSGKTTAGFVVLAELASINIGLDTIDKWHKLPKDFVEATSFCSFSAATDIAQGVLVSLKIQGNTILSCDNRRATEYTMSGKLPKNTDFLLSRRIIEKMIDYNPIEFALTENWIHFKNEGKTIFSCHEMHGDYPDISQVFGLDKSDKVELPKALIDTLSKTELFSTITATGAKYIEMSIKKDRIICRSESDDGWIEDTVDCNYDGEPITVNIDPEMLKQIIKHIKIMEVGGSKVLFQGDNFRHMIALFG